MNDVFCPLPWTHLATKANGDLRLCCNSHQGPNNGLLRNESGEVYNLNRNRISESRNADLAKDVRRAMLNNEKHTECRRCWDEEKFNIRSRRLQTLEYVDNYEEAVKITAADGSIPDDHPYSDFDLRFGNLCNLKCRMCGPFDSSMWYEDHFLMTGAKFDDSGFKWYDRKEVWEDLESQIPTAEYVYIIGGEPTLIQSHFDFLQKCIDKDHAKDIKLEYSTNLTNIQQKYLDIWSHFKGVHIGCSLDGVGAVNEYIRYPSKWKAIEKNLARLNNHMADNLSLVLSITVCAYNIYYLDDIYKWNALNHNLAISPHPLYRPKELNPKILPRSAKEAIAKKLRASYPWFEENIPRQDPKMFRYDKSAEKIIKDIEGYIEFMMSEDLSQELPSFWKLTNQLDEIRKEDIESSLPELYDLIKDTEFKSFY
ncbi:COG0535 Predicted Fe-S oxidoreductases [uncultured Caudovirales phage]|uniref:COG0535 Predicted Fe-S oxidoreductases n=1 Tax=uncultured Caudovirales phage TaxID=2100421 RepID=A0A6J7WUY9_9CAUD|nr:COG0535 Predicted Fe-S oxidoreductases [uncultured Caudovirales phage]